MGKPQHILGRILGELKRRHVIRVMAAYAVTVWVVLQVADILLPALGAPDWTMSALVVASLAGAPLTALLTWFYDLTPEGVVLTDDANAQVVSEMITTGRGIDYVIIAVLLLILAFLLWRPGDRIGAGNSDHSIAVLPFADLTVDESGRYFGDGVAETVMDQLAQIRGLKVSARTSAFAFRDSALDATELAEQLGVGKLLEGSVRREGNQFRISARLIDGKTGHQIWSDHFAGTLGEAFQIQDRVAVAVARALEVQTLPGAMTGLDTRNAEAYDHYLQGRAHLRAHAGISGTTAAIASFSDALALDEGFGLAAAGLCRARWELYEINRSENLAESALQTCRRVQNEHPELIETRIATASLLIGTGQAQQAETIIREAHAEQPNNAEVQLTLGLALRDQGRLDEARSWMQRAVELDPADWNYRFNFGIVQLMSGRLDSAIESLRSSASLNPGSPQIYNTLGGAYFMRGDFLKAADAFEQSLKLEPTPVAYSNAGTNYFFAEQYPQAEAMFHRAVELAPEDFRYIGFLAWAIRAQPGREQAATPFHQQVIKTATRRLVINEQDDEARAALALHLAALDLDTAARGVIDSLGELARLEVNAKMMIGFAYFYLDQYEPAVEMFNQALDDGLPAFALRLDPRLKESWHLPAFQMLDQARLAANTAPEGEMP